MQVSLNTEQSEIEMKSGIIHHDLSFIIGDLKILAALNVFQDLWHAPDSREVKDYISTIFRQVSQERQIYDQVRLLDNEGFEIVRINLQNNVATVVPDENLQNKKHRPYFSNTIRLKPGEVYVSPFDLNIENKNIEVPLKPILRFATPMFDENGVRKGILVLNCLGSFILKNSDRVGHNRFKEHFMLLNQNGYWLKAPDAELEWGFMFDDKHTINFQHYYPEVWETIHTKEAGQLESEKGLFTFSTIYPLKNNTSSTIWTDEEAPTSTDNFYWKAVSFVPHAELYKNHEAENRHLFIVYLLLITLSGWGAWVLAYSINKRKIAEERTNRNLAKLKELNATKDRFFSIIAHDLRSPFNAMLGFSEILKEEANNGNTEHIKEYTNYLFENILKTFNLLNELLDWANLQRKKVSFEPRIIDAGQCADEILQILELSAQNKKQTLTKSVPKGLELKADRNMLCTIVRNLLSNAIKFTPEGGSIAFIAKLNDKECVFTVADTGIGISPENLKKLFKIEESISTTGTDNETGTGLGLILCKELVEKHGGRIWAESETGKGTKFHFSIPLS